jgi:hypothetical protein
MLGTVRRHRCTCASPPTLTPFAGRRGFLALRGRIAGGFPHGRPPRPAFGRTVPPLRRGTTEHVVPPFRRGDRPSKARSRGVDPRTAPSRLRRTPPNAHSVRWPEGVLGSTGENCGGLSPGTPPSPGLRPDGPPAPQGDNRALCSPFPKGGPTEQSEVEGG